MGAVKNSAIPRNLPLVKKYTRVPSQLCYLGSYIIYMYKSNYVQKLRPCFNVSRIVATARYKITARLTRIERRFRLNNRFFELFASFPFPRFLPRTVFFIVFVLFRENLRKNNLSYTMEFTCANGLFVQKFVYSIFKHNARA